MPPFESLKPAVDWVSSLSGTGVLIIFIIALWKGWIVTQREHSAVWVELRSIRESLDTTLKKMRRLRKRAARLQKQVDELTADLAKERALKHDALDREQALLSKVEELQLAVGIKPEGPQS